MTVAFSSWKMRLQLRPVARIKACVIARRAGSSPVLAVIARRLCVTLRHPCFVMSGIETTTAKAKELRPFAERLITLARRGDVHARRLAATKIQDREVLGKLFDEIAPRYLERPGGYTRVLKLGNRKGDAAEMSLIELVG